MAVNLGGMTVYLDRLFDMMHGNKSLDQKVDIFNNGSYMSGLAWKSDTALRVALQNQLGTTVERYLEQKQEAQEASDYRNSVRKRKLGTLNVLGGDDDEAQVATKGLG